MRLLAFDQASKRSAYAIFVDTGLADWGLIDFSKETDLPKRTRKMYTALYDLITTRRIDTVVFEGVNFRVNPKTVIQLAQIQGGIMLACYLNDVDFATYEPGKWRKIVGIAQGKGVKRDELKAEAIAFVKESYGISVGDDVAESICIGLAYLRDHELLPDLENLSTKKERKK